MDTTTVLYLIILTLAMSVKVNNVSVFDWIKSDKFDQVDAHFRSVNGGTCRSRSKEQMVMRADVVSQLPVYNQLLSKVWYANRTALIHLHNMALNRAFFYSFILQKMNDSSTFTRQPNWLYFYLSAAADVNANPFMLNGSALYFDTNTHYPNWYITVHFNRTLKLFGPKAFRWDDYRDPDNLLREPTRRVVKVNDLGSGSFSNYTHSGYKMNTWYHTWLPDVVGDRDSVTKFTYNVGIKRSHKTGEFTKNTFENVAFFGPSSPGARVQDARMLPVQWTVPYFDCGGSNKWVVSAVSPVVDFMPRYSNYTHLRRQRVVALVVMDIDLNKIDFNSCGVSPGNPGPSYLSGIDKCKKTTSCKHVPGFGLRRGGYKCVCKAGKKYPWSAEPTFWGTDIEQATELEYKEGFSCDPTNYGLVLPVIDDYLSSQLGDLNLRQPSSISRSFNNSTRQRRDSPLGQNSKSERKRNTSSECTPDDVTNASSSRTVQNKIHTTGPGLLNAELPENSDNIDCQNDSNETMLTPQQMMQLADMLRVIRERDHNQPQQEESNRQQVTSLYLSSNDVDTEVELKYQQDIQDHRVYQETVLAQNPIATLANQLLLENLFQLRERHIDRFTEQQKTSRPGGRRKRSVFDQGSYDRMMNILRQKASVTASNCATLPGHQLFLPGDVGYGVERQFEPEGRTAVRLTHFLSVYLQNAQPEKNFGNLKGGGYLQEDHLFGEVLANVMGNFRILSAGVFFDRNKFVVKGSAVRELFGPWSFRKDGSFYAIDKAGQPDQYVKEDWFLKAKSRFQSNFAGLATYKIKAHVRSNPAGVSSVRYGFYPIIYRAADYSQGFWTQPYFQCDGHVNAWVVTYVSPFFGANALRTSLEFRGVATVDVPLDLLEINQCPQSFLVANAFKNTAMCDYFSTTCSPIAGFPFSRGAYMCSCRLGFEYWHADGKEWFEGSFIELEYQKKLAGYFSRWDHLYCRPSLASRNSFSLVFVMIEAMLLSWILVCL